MAMANSPNSQPKNCGWVLKNSTFKIKWLEGEMSLSTVKIIVKKMKMMFQV